MSDLHLKQHVLRCKNCVVATGQSINVCERCFPEAWASHDQNHAAVSVQFQSVTDEIPNGYRCTQCPFSEMKLEKSSPLMLTD